MRNMYSFILILFLAVFGFQNHSHAQLFPGNPDGSIGTGNATGGGGSCSWDAFLEQLGCQETGFVCPGASCPKSCDRQYTVASPRAHDPSWGKWQFTPDTWRRYTAVEYPQCQGMQQSMSPECRPAQKWAAEQMMNNAVKWLKERDWCGSKLGQTITGTHQGTTLTCKVNKSGLLSAYHNAEKNACNFVAGSSKWTSQINWRVCDAQGIPFPENCTPEDSSAPFVPDEVTPTEPFIAPEDQLFPKASHFTQMNISLKYILVAAFQNMTSELTSFMMQQVHIIGQFFDAKHQLETQMLLRQKTAEAWSDYQPSEQFCMIGTFTKDLLMSERQSDFTKIGLSKSMLDRALATEGSKTSQERYDPLTKEKALINTFCDPNDNSGNNEELCQGEYDPDQINADINYTKTIDSPLTLDIDLLDNEASKDEENIFAFLDYIFMHEKFPWKSKSETILFNFIEPYMEMRSIIAIRSVAQNSFTEIIAQKAAGPDKEGIGNNAGPFQKALLRDFGIEDTEIEKMLGENPSYYAQMEMLTKKIYQHPDFISNLYDKPANVKRMQAALTAIKLMQDRDIHDALMRREMLMSMLLEIQLRQKQLDLTSSRIDMINKLPAGEAESTVPPDPTGGGAAGPSEAEETGF